MEQQDFSFVSQTLESPKDYRDIPLSAVYPPTSQPESFFVDITKLPIWMQNKLGACVGHAGAKYGQRLNQVETGQVIACSARFLYALAKCNDGYDGEGTYPRQLMKMWQTYGIATEATIPNDTTLSHEAYCYDRKIANIPKVAFDEAQPYKIKSYAFPELNEVGLKNAIINANGAIILMRVGDEWWTSKDGKRSTWDPADIIPLRAPEKITSGHEVYLYGYDYLEGKLRFWILNSWSEKWGIKGTGWFYWDEMKSFIVEAITAVDMSNTWIDESKKLPKENDFKHEWKTDIAPLSRGPEVNALQIALKIDGCFPAGVSVTDYFGPITIKAVKDFQLKYGVASPAEIESAGGRVGPKTRTQLNKLFNK